MEEGRHANGMFCPCHLFGPHRMTKLWGLVLSFPDSSGPKTQTNSWEGKPSQLSPNSLTTTQTQSHQGGENIRGHREKCHYSVTQSPQPEIARLWTPHHSEASLQTWQCASKGHFRSATLHGPFESTEPSCLVSIYGQGIVFGFSLLPFQTERVCITLSCMKRKQLIISAIFSLYRGTIIIFFPQIT